MTESVCYVQIWGPNCLSQCCVLLSSSLTLTPPSLLPTGFYYHGPKCRSIRRTHPTYTIITWSRDATENTSPLLYRPQRFCYLTRLWLWYDHAIEGLASSNRHQNPNIVLPLARRQSRPSKTTRSHIERCVIFVGMIQFKNTISP